MSLCQLDVAAETDRLLDAAEVAARLNVGEGWVRESARSGLLPCVRLGRYVRFDWADILAWLDQQRQPGRDGRLRRYAGVSS